jgi:hypothetical protein
MAQGHDALIELLKQRHDFTNWSGTGQSAAAPIRDVQLGPADVGGWTVVRSQRKAGMEPPRSDSFLRPADSKPTERGPLVRVEIFELPTVEAARAHLLAMLAEFQSAEFGRRTDLALGDVVFGFDTALLFARANLVVLVRNAERHTVVVVPVAQAVDAALLRRLSAGGGTPR